MKTKVSAIICAAGSGKRAGFGKNKLLVPLYGAPALYHTLEKFALPQIDEVIVTSSKSDFEEISALCKPFGFTVVKGGKTRTESVKNALEKVTGEIVLIHDGARPFVKKELILNCIDGVEKFGSAVCAVKCRDSLACGHLGQETAIFDRESAYRLQTPQGFYTEDIKRAYRLAGDKVYTDDSSVYLEFIAPCKIIEGDEENIKLTYAADFNRENAFYSYAGARVGYGVDVHAFGEGDGVTLGGIKIPCDKSLIAHSDGDVLVHAVMDALLSAAGLDDIGHFFPDNDGAYAGADSCVLLNTVIKEIKKLGYAPLNVSATVQAETPRLSPYIGAIKEKLCKICDIDEKDFAIAAGTCEGLGFVGKGLGICAYCAVMLKEV